jgi:phosphoribosylformylglycinamidine synthase subunit PurL
LLKTEQTPPKGLALRPEEIARIRERLGREPSIVELHAFDAQWSEHCSYKSSRRHLKKLPTAGENVIVGPGEDAGVVYLGEHNGERYCVVIAHESHNHPSQVVPFEGAATGVGGIVRDVLCMGAEVIGLADCLRFGDVSDLESHQTYVARSVVDGIGAYGNAIGVPNIAGDAYFHEGFNENCLVNVIALGLVKENEIIHSRAPQGSAGWDLVLVGKATDASGFGGASFASLTLDSQAEEANKAAVQVPDPFLKNVIMRATYRVFALLRERKITAGFKDLGAGGIMGCSAELCASGGYGAEIDLDKVNLALPDLPPEVIAVGEAQERLIWVLPPEITPEVLGIYNDEFTLPQIAYNARAVPIGKVTERKQYVLRHHGETVMDVPIEFLTQPIESDEPAGTAASARTKPRPEGRDAIDLCSREPLYRRYDAVVRGTTVLARGRADAGVIAPIPGSRLGIALGVAGDPLLSPAAMATAKFAVTEAVCRVVAGGARPVALTDCLNFGNPQKADHYKEFVDAVEGLRAAANTFGLPFVSGNVSFYNESSHGNPVPASPIVGCVGVIDDISKVLTPAFKQAGSLLITIGPFSDSIDVLLDAMERGSVRSCTIVGMGGIEMALARMSVAAAEEGRSLGADADVSGPPVGFIVELAKGAQLEGATQLGLVIDEPTIPWGEGRIDVDRLRAAWSYPLAEVYP